MGLIIRVMWVRSGVIPLRYDSIKECLIVPFLKQLFFQNEFFQLAINFDASKVLNINLAISRLNFSNDTRIGNFR